MTIKVRPAVGLSAIILFGVALSACAGGVGGGPAATGEPFCQPGICVGSTPGSTPDQLQMFAP